MKKLLILLPLMLLLAGCGSRLKYLCVYPGGDTIGIFNTIIIETEDWMCGYVEGEPKCFEKKYCQISIE